MEYVIGIIIGAVAALAAAWFFYLKPKEARWQVIAEDHVKAVAKANAGLEAVTGLHTAVTGGFGIPLDGLYNKMWNWADLEEIGAP